MKAQVVALAWMVVAGCSKSNPLFTDASTRCISEADCGPATPVCDESSGTCVQCSAPDEVDACTDIAPVCGSDHTCRACAAHAECESSACAPGGSCALASNVAYVSSAGTQNAACTQDEPCTTLGAAIATARPFVKVTGTIAETAIIDIARQVTILSEPGAKLIPAGNAVPLTVRGTSKVAIFDLIISNGSGPVAVGLNVDAGAPTIALTRVTISDNLGGGIKTVRGTLSLTKCEIRDNAGNGMLSSATTIAIVETLVARNTGLFGVRATDNSTVTVQSSTFTGNGDGLSVQDTPLVVERSSFINNVDRGVVSAFNNPATAIRRSRIIGNTGGGMQLRGRDLDVSNNFIVRNGTTNGVVGGLALEPVSGKVEHNTIVDNVAPRITGRTEAGGVDCAAAGFRLEHNLIFRNQGGEFGTIQIAGTCDFSGSLLLSATSSTDNTPGFASPNAEPFDYHLTAATPTTIRNAAGACTGTDFDGDARPQEGACDIGADELVPQH